eukprot:UN04890
MELLFRTLSIYCPFLKSIDLSGTNISNQTCLFIYHHFIHSTNDNNIHNHNNAPRIIHIKLYSTKIDANGIQLLSKTPSSSNLIKLKVYLRKTTNDNKLSAQKGKGRYQRNIRDLMQKRRK